MIIHNMEQGSPEWDAIRVDHPFSASKAQAIQAQGKGLDTLIIEKLAAKYSTGEKQRFISSDMEHGTLMEPYARDMYQTVTGIEVEEVGFVTNAAISPMAGVSPDGLSVDVSLDLCHEFKCPSDNTYFQMLMHYSKTGEVDIQSGYMWQMQMQMLFTGRSQAHFAAFNHNFEKMPILITEVTADPVKQAKITSGLATAIYKYELAEDAYRKLVN